MLKKRIIPCLDVNAGRVVKGVNFVGLKDAGDPVTVAKKYSDENADEIVFLDITATSDGRESMYDVIEKTACEIRVPLTVGGGVRKMADIKNLLKLGADKVAINSAAVKNPEFVKEASDKFGVQCIVVAIDAKKSVNTKSGYEIFTHGGRKPTAIDALEWALKMQSFGAGEILLTSMDSDGTKKGFDLDLTKMISENLKIPVIASGGVGNLQHLHDGFCKGKASAVLAASIFHYGEYTIFEAKEFLKEKGIEIRG